MTDEKVPFVSIVVPAFNEEDAIYACLESLVSLDYPKDRHEIILVDNGSTDRTVEIAETFNVKVASIPGVRVGAVRNYGAKVALGDVLAFTDADCVVPPGWITSGLTMMRETGAVAIGGKCLLRDNPSWVESAWVLDLEPKDEVAHSLAGGSILVRSSEFDSVGGFDEELNAGEDTDLAIRLIRSGHKIYMAAGSSVVHLGYPVTLGVFLARQHWQASSYIERAKSGVVDKMFYTVTAFLTLAIVFPFLLIFCYKAGIVALILILFLPALLTVRRALKANLRKVEIRSFVQMYVLDFTYLIGRSSGLIKSGLVELGLIRNKKGYY